MTAPNFKGFTNETLKQLQEQQKYLKKVIQAAEKIEEATKEYKELVDLGLSFNLDNGGNKKNDDLEEENNEKVENDEKVESEKENNTLEEENDEIPQGPKINLSSLMNNKD